MKDVGINRVLFKKDNVLMDFKEQNYINNDVSDAVDECMNIFGARNVICMNENNELIMRKFFI